MVTVVFPGVTVGQIPERPVLLLDSIVHVVNKVLVHIITLLFFASGGRNMLLDFFIIHLFMVLALFPDEFLEIPVKIITNENITLFQSFLLFQVPIHLQTFLLISKTHLDFLMLLM